MVTQDSEKRLPVEEVTNIYRERSKRSARQGAAFAIGAQRTRAGYMAAHFTAVACLLLAGSEPLHAARWFAASGVLLGVGAVGVLLERQLRCRQRMHELFHLCNKHALARMGRSWEKVPVPRCKVPARSAPQADDLDLFGPASLFHLLCRARTAMGITTLRDWLLEPASPIVIRQRQQAVDDLRPALPFRQEVEVRTAMLGQDPQSFLRWVEGPTWFGNRASVKWCLLVQSAMPTVAVIATILGWMPPGMGVGVACGACLINLIITTFLGAQIHEVFREAAARDGVTKEYVKLSELMARTPGTSTMATRLRQIAADSNGAICGLRGLAPIMVFGYAHRDPLKLAMYLPLQLFMLWDFYLLVVLERWQRRWVPHCRRWFQSLGELEALASLASLAQENPEWCLPDIDEQHPKGLEVQQLGHPLLADCVRVSNDVKLGPPGTLLFVSGSNMSGKSTLLRAIGVNVVLAQAGGPVCATQWTMSPVELATVIRIDDSLVDGVSLFLAGLDRVKDVVNRARAFSGPSERSLVYLLDEPLRGTNPRDRRIASQKLIQILLKHGAIGAVSSHDVELASEGILADACVLAHFQETLDKSQQPIRIAFDYKMRHGLATSTNALELVELVGLE